jgi:hypothetical protein
MSGFRRHERLIRTWIKNILLESLEDVVDIQIRIRLKSSKRSITDVLTDLRGLRNVITVSQTEASQDAEDGKTRILVNVRFEDDAGMSLEDLESEIMSIPEVDLITVTSFDGVEMRRVT